MDLGDVCLLSKRTFHDGRREVAAVLLGKCAVNSSGISPQHFTLPFKESVIILFFFFSFHVAKKTEIAKQLLSVTLSLDEEYGFGRRQPPGEPGIL